MLKGKLHFWGRRKKRNFCISGDGGKNARFASGLQKLFDCPFCPIQIISLEMLSHRSVLGSILGLGIAREKIGDIIINGNNAVVFAIDSVVELILNDLKFVGREKVKTQLIDFLEIIVPEKEEKIIDTTVASLRLDAILSSALGISREKSCDLIESEKVSVNYKLVTSVKKQVIEGDLLSVRGYGRIVLAEVKGESKSGRIKIKINKV